MPGAGDAGEAFLRHWPYDPTVRAQTEAKLKLKKLKHLMQNAAALGCKLLCPS
jgi:hypothetical protein